MLFIHQNKDTREAILSVSLKVVIVVVANHLFIGYKKFAYKIVMFGTRFSLATPTGTRCEIIDRKKYLYAR